MMCRTAFPRAVPWADLFGPLRGVVLPAPKGRSTPAQGKALGMRAATVAGLLNLAVISGANAQPPPAPAIPAVAASAESAPPTYTIVLHTRNACVTPHAHRLARAEGGYIDVAAPAPNVLTMSMTGTAAANSYLCTTGAASEKFQLVQDLEITCSDPKQTTVGLTLDTSLVGFVRSKGKAGACMRLAQVCLAPVEAPETPLSQSYPPLCVDRTAGQLCNQHLPPLEVPAMPVGRYTLTATFVLDTTASGICDSHAVADFSPDTTLPPEWVRTRDPFQGVSKKSFGFTATITAAPPPPTGPGVANTGLDRGNVRTQVMATRGELADRLGRRTSP
jgi:hypothetical protein